MEMKLKAQVLIGVLAVIFIANTEAGVEGPDVSSSELSFMYVPKFGLLVSSTE